jgi:hypothetical protein
MAEVFLGILCPMLSLSVILLGGIWMKQLAVLIIITLITILLSGCGIPDLPGPIGIPGL